MANPAPRLTTSADPSGYAPYSITAILAAIVAGLFLLVMLVLGGSALIGGQQLVEPLLLILPAAIIVLSFAARRQIQNSEGTRVGLNLCNFAWWVGVLGGSGYAAYLVGRNLAVQQDTKDALVQWVETLKKADPIDPRNLEFHRAYQMTIDTGRQKSLDAKTAEEVEAAQRGFYEDTPGMIGITRFRQIDLVRVLHRNRGFPIEFTFDGLQTWAQDASGLRCKSAGTLRCPEGEFKLNFDMMRQAPPGERPIWRIVVPTSGFVSTVQLSNYGRKLAEMEFVARALVTNAILPTLSRLPQFRSRFIEEYTALTDSEAAVRYYSRCVAECAALGILGTVRPPSEGYETRMKLQFFSPIQRTDGQKDGNPSELFFSAWQYGRIVPSGAILRESPDQFPLLTITDKSVEIRIPIEIQQPRMESSLAAARGAIVFVCDDPKFIAELNELRKASATEELGELGSLPENMVAIPWRIKQIVSDMKNVTMPKPEQAPGAPGG